MELDLNIPGAFSFYKKYILDFTKDKSTIYEEYGFRVTGSIPSQDWEVFGAILLKDKANPAAVGSDLINYEVKSAIKGSSFEYQYHREFGLEKLVEDKKVDHLYFSYSHGYQDVEVRIVTGAILTPTFDAWRPGLVANYSSEIPRQRYRKSISLGFVTEHGKVIMLIRNGELIDLPD